MRPWVRRLGLFTAASAGIGGLGLLGTYAALRTESGNDWLTRQLDTRIDDYLGAGADLQIGRLRTDLWAEVHGWDLALVDADGQELLTVERLGVRWMPTSVLGGVIAVPQVHLSGVRYRDRLDDEGTLGILRALGLDGPSADPDAPLYSGLGVDLLLRNVHLRDAAVHLEDADGGVLFDATGLTLHGSATALGERLSLGPLVGAGHVTAPVEAHTTLGGSVVLTGDELTESDLWLVLGGSRVDVRGTLPLAGDAVGDGVIDVRRLRLDDLEQVIGDQGLQGLVQGELALEGPLSALSLQGELDGGEDSGRIALDLGADVAGDLSWTARVALDEVRPQTWVPSAGDTDVSGVFEGSGAGTTWPGGVSAQATFTGTSKKVVGLEVLEALDLSASLDNGVLTLEGLDANSPLSRVTGTGTLDLTTGEVDVKLGGPVHLAELRRVGVEGLSGEGTYTARLLGNVFESPPRLVVGGNLDTAVSYGGSVNTRASGAYQVRLGTEMLTLDTELTLTRTDLGGALAIDTVRTPVHATVALDGSRIKAGGHAHVEGIRDATQQLEAQGLDGPWTFSMVDGHLDASVDASVGWLAVAGMASDHGIASVTLHDDDLHTGLTLWDRSRTYLELDASVALSRMALRADHLTFAPTWTHTWRSEGPLTARLDGDRVEDLDLKLTSERGALRAAGALGMSGPWDARVVVDGFQLDLLAEYLPEQLGGTSGTVDVTASLTGSAENPGVQADVKLQQLWYGELVQWLDVSGPVSLADGLVETSLDIGVADRPIAELRAKVPVHSDLTATPGLDAAGELLVDAAVLPGRLERFGWLLPAVQLPDGMIGAHLVADGTLADPKLVLTSVADTRTPGWNLPLRTELEATRTGSELSLDVQVYEGLSRRGALTGSGANRWEEVLAYATGGAAPDWNDWTLWASELEVYFRPTEWPLPSLLAPVLAVTGASLAADVQGSLSGELRLTGSPLRPVVRSDLHVTQGSIGDVPLEGLDLVITPSPRGYQTSLIADFSDQGSLSIVGDVPAKLDLENGTLESWLPDGMKLDVVGSVPIALAPALGAPISKPVGAVSVSGDITGSARAPVPDLRLRVEDAGMIVEPLSLKVAKTNAQAHVSVQGIEVSEYSLQTSPAGALLGNITDTTERLLVNRDQTAKSSKVSGRATAKVRWGDIEPSLAALFDQDVRIEALAELDRAWLSAKPSQQLQLSGGVRLAGDWPNLDASGALRVDYGFARIDAAELFVSNPLEPDRVLTIHRAGEVQEREDEEPPFWAPFTANVAVDLGRNVNGEASLPLLDDLGQLGATFSKVEGSARVGGSLVVGLDRGVPTARGTLEILDGKASALQSNFDLDEGTVRFIGGPITDPTLDLAASMQASDATVEMRISGTATEPEIVFSCEEYPEQSQIFTLLLTGQPPDEVGADEGQAAQAVAGLLASSVLGGANLGVIDIQPDGSLRIGIPIDRQLYGSVYLAPLETDVDENKVEVEMEWVILDNFVLSGRYGDVNSGGELLWEHRF